MVKLNILSDWNQQLDAYNAPKVLIKKLMNKHKNLSFDFDDNKKGSNKYLYRKSPI